MASTRSKPYGVLVVDDDASVLRMLQLVLSGLPIELETASNADAALERLEAGARPHLVIADYRMPGRDGVELLQEIRRRYRFTTLVLHAAVPPDEVPPGVSILPKPAGAQMVRDFVADRLTVHSLVREMEARRAAEPAA